jgi:hypothetical protein
MRLPRRQQRPLPNCSYRFFQWRLGSGFALPTGSWRWTGWKRRAPYREDMGWDHRLRRESHFRAGLVIDSRC